MDGDAKVALRDFPISLMPAEGTAVMPAFGKADEAGAFTLDHVTPASYDLSLPFSPEGTYVTSVVFNDRDALGQVLDCSAIAAGTVRITLGTDGGKVEANVSRDDMPVPNGTVVLLPADPSRRFPLTMRRGLSDGTGRLLVERRSSRRLSRVRMEGSRGRDLVRSEFRESRGASLHPVPGQTESE